MTSSSTKIPKQDPPAVRAFKRAVTVTVSGLEVFVDGVSVCVAPDEKTRDLVANTYAAMQTDREPL